MLEYFDYCEKHQVVDKFPLGSIILHETVLSGSDEESFFFSKAPAEFVSDRLYRKPAGNYAMIVHKGELGTFGPAYQHLLQYIHQQNLRICGDAYIYDLVSYPASGTEEHYILKISIQVE